MPQHDCAVDNTLLCANSAARPCAGRRLAAVQLLDAPRHGPNPPHLLHRRTSTPLVAAQLSRACVLAFFRQQCAVLVARTRACAVPVPVPVVVGMGVVVVAVVKLFGGRRGAP